MTKAKVALNNSKNNLKHPKDGAIQKKKQQKFKNTPNGKVPLINGTPSKTTGKQVSPKNGNGVMKSPKSPKSAKSAKSPKSPIGSATDKTEVVAKKTPKGKKKEKEEDDDSEDDINEGISINEVVSGQEDEEDDDDSSDDEAVPDVFTTTLPDATDESDADFDVETAENKGVKMFRGVNKVKNEAEDSNEEEDDEEDEDDDEDDEDDEEDEDEDKPVLGLSALLGDSIKDESGDEDFIGMDDSEEDEDDDDDDEDEEESDDEVADQSLNSSTVTSTDEDEEEDDDDDDEDDEDEDDDDEASPDLTDLLGTSLGDDSDDNDFEADDEDKDVSNEEDTEEVAESKKKQKKEKKTAPESPKLTPEELAELDKRTIFIGNIPKDTKVQVLTREFKKYGPIETVRLRGIIPGDPKMSLKVAAIKRNFHEKSSAVCAFIRYKNEESVQKALAMNGKKFQGNYLRVDRSQRPKAGDKKKSVFLGNLPFTVEDNELWEAFKGCGKIESVRIIRHRTTGLGRGFGYINFETADGAVLALSLDGTEISNRKVRVHPCSGQEAAKKHQQQQRTPEKGGKRKQRSESESNDSPKKVKTDDSETVERATHNSLNAEKRMNKGKKRSQGDKQRAKSNSASPKSDASPTKFQGQTSGTKNKKQKQDKTSKKKKQMAAKLLAKPKKPSAN